MICREQKAEEEEAAKLKEFLKEREEKIKIFQAAAKGLFKPFYRS